VITGYPPFLKHLVDESEARGLNWKEYRAFGIVGGEGMSERLRAYLERRLVAVYSCYGASDLDIGVAAEVPVSIWIRKQAAANPRLQRALFGNDSRLPMLFQYNPLDYHVESVAGEHGVPELVVTVTRRTLLSPRIRYNVHDEGGALSWAGVLDTCRQFGIDPLADAPRPAGGTQPRLPFLFVRGRSDTTLSFMGANIYPEDVEAGLYADVDEQRCLGAFALELVDAGGGRQRPCVHVEVLDGAVDDERLRTRVADRVCRGLAAASSDFRTALAESGEAARPEVRLHLPGTGPFTENARRIKRRYVIAGAR
jgi:phenylacetate-CoA ligase